MKHTIILYTLLSLTLASYAQADSASCKLTSVESEEDAMSVTGTYTVTLEDGNYKHYAKGEITIPNEEVSEFEVDDLGPLLVYNSSTSPTAEEALKNDDIGAILIKRLSGEKPVELKIYAGKNFQDDGSGLMLYQAKGEKGTTKGIALLGWMGAYCD